MSAIHKDYDVFIVRLIAWGATGKGLKQQYIPFHKLDPYQAHFIAPNRCQAQLPNQKHIECHMKCMLDLPLNFALNHLKKGSLAAV